MMICDADFDELFAPAARPEPRPGAADPASLARWEDDGGRVAQIRRAAAAPRLTHPAGYGHRAAHPALAGAALMLVPAATAQGAAAAMLAAYARLSQT